MLPLLAGTPGSHCVRPSFMVMIVDEVWLELL